MKIISYVPSMTWHTQSEENKHNNGQPPSNFQIERVMQ